MICYYIMLLHKGAKGYTHLDHQLLIYIRSVQVEYGLERDRFFCQS